MLTKAQRRAIRLAYKALNWLNEQMTSLCDDPMTQAMGAPVDDFYADWARKARRMQAYALTELKRTGVKGGLADALVDELTSHI